MPQTPVERLLTKPITLVMREVTTDEDAWGSPLVTETTLETRCYYRLVRTTDTDADGTVVSEQYEIFLPASTPVDPWSAVILDGRRYEVLGRPDPEWNARIGEVNHIKLRVDRSQP